MYQMQAVSSLEFTDFVERMFHIPTQEFTDLVQLSTGWSDLSAPVRVYGRVQCVNKQNVEAQGVESEARHAALQVKEGSVPNVPHIPHAIY